MVCIEEITVRKILDSRGNVTVEAEVFTGLGSGRAAAPAGASTGTHEAVVVDPDTCLAVARERVIPALIGTDATDQVTFDTILRDVDGTGNFASIGANLAVALSLANASAAADSIGLPLFQYLGGIYASSTPYPLGNVIGGGVHASGATDIQEFLVVPTGSLTAEEGVFANAAVHRRVRDILISRGHLCGKGDEGAWAPRISDQEAFEILDEAVGNVSDELGLSIRIGIDVAASELWDGERYRYSRVERSPEDQAVFLAEMADRYNLVYIEDPFHEEAFEDFAALTEEIGDRCLVCGDDLFVTNPARIQEGFEKGAANCVLIKPNQIGTLTDMHEAITLAKNSGMETVMSHRSGETTDMIIAHLATAFNCIFLKSGVVGGERIAKLNELIRIEEMI
ncbi:MAG: phosphopyruvate hydratase [Methanoculleaceae archaeon]